MTANPAPDRAHRLHDLARSAAKARPAAVRLRAGSLHALLAAIAATAAYLPAHALGLREGFWGAITAVAVTQTELEGLRDTARDQALGALIGGIVGGGTATTTGTGLGAHAGAGAIAIVFARAASAASAARLSAITVTVVLLVPHAGGVAPMVAARLSEMWWGLAVAWPALAFRRAGRA